MKFALDILLMSGLYMAEYSLWQTDLAYIFVILGASIAGAFRARILRRDRDIRRFFYKTSIRGDLRSRFGCDDYAVLHIESTAYMIGVYFFLVALSLFFIRALLNRQRQNASRPYRDDLSALTNTSVPNKVIPDDEPPPQIVEPQLSLKNQGDLIECWSFC